MDGDPGSRTCKTFICGASAFLFPRAQHLRGAGFVRRQEESRCKIMITIYLSDGGRMLEQDKICPVLDTPVRPEREGDRAGVAPCSIDPDLVRAALDEEERSRIEVEDEDGTPA